MRILFVRQLAVIELGIRFVVILNFLVRGHADISQASSLRGVIFADGNIEMRAVGKREAGLEIALAAGLLAHDLRPVVFLKRRSEKFRRRIRVPVHEHDHRKLDARTIRRIGLRFARVVLALEDGSLWQELIEKLHHLVFISAAVEAHVK